MSCANIQKNNRDWRVKVIDTLLAVATEVPVEHIYLSSMLIKRPFGMHIISQSVEYLLTCWEMSLGAGIILHIWHRGH